MDFIGHLFNRNKSTFIKTERNECVLRKNKTVTLRAFLLVHSTCDVVKWAVLVTFTRTYEVLRARPRESVVKWRIALRLPNAFNEYIQKTSWHAELSLPLAKNENAEDFKTCFCTRTESS